MSTILISVVVPLYNKELSILTTVNSVLSQEYRDFELIIVNDGSTDKSKEIVSRVTDKRIKIFSKPNGGVSAARNYGVKKANGDFIFFLDADDTLLPNCLSIYFDLMQDYPDINFFTTNFFTKNEYGDESVFCFGTKKGLLKQSFKSLWKREVFPKAGSILIRKEKFEDVGGFRNECSIWEDLELVLLLLRHNQVVYSPKAVYIYNLEFNELSQKLKPLTFEFAYYVELDKAKNIYHKFILLELLMRILKKRKELNDHESVVYLSQKIRFNKPLLFFARAERFISKKLRLLTDSFRRKLNNSESTLHLNR